MLGEYSWTDPDPETCRFKIAIGNKLGKSKSKGLADLPSKP
jgi:hypothetical protein